MAKSVLCINGFYIFVLVFVLLSVSSAAQKFGIPRRNCSECEDIIVVKTDSAITKQVDTIVTDCVSTAANITSKKGTMISDCITDTLRSNDLVIPNANQVAQDIVETCLSPTKDLVELKFSLGLSSCTYTVINDNNKTASFKAQCQSNCKGIDANATPSDANSSPLGLGVVRGSPRDCGGRSTCKK